MNSFRVDKYERDITEKVNERENRRRNAIDMEMAEEDSEAENGGTHEYLDGFRYSLGEPILSYSENDIKTD